MKAVKSLGATWTILNRQMKKDKKYFLGKLSCGISRKKSNNSIEQLRGPKMRGSNNIAREGSKNSLVTYAEMLPGKPDEDLSSLDLSANHSKSPNKNQIRDRRARTYGDKESLKSFPNSSSRENLSSLHTSPNKINLGILLSMSHQLRHSPISPLHEANRKDRGSANGSHEMEHMENVETNPNTIQKEKGAIDDGVEIRLSECQQNQRLDSFVCQCGNARPKLGWKRDFTYDELRVATENFSNNNLISEDGFGFVYKGELMDGQKIAVKQYKHASLLGEREFKKELDVLSKARHKNVVMLLGACSERNHRLLVYEFVCNGSLDQHLSTNSTAVLSWPARLKIALGAAEGLQYLHSNNIIHRDMRPNNILVTHHYEPMLGDFGLARSQCEGPDHSSDTRVVGTTGYLAHEYTETRKVSKKTDVYCFGVVLLELLTGRSTMDKGIGEKSLVGWARPLLKERKYPELIDPMILDSCDVHLHELFWMIEMCLSEDPEKRLNIDKVVYMLKCVKNGENFIDIEDFSPPHSDLKSGKGDNNEAREKVESVLKERVYNQTCTKSEDDDSAVEAISSVTPTTACSSLAFIVASSNDIPATCSVSPQLKSVTHPFVSLIRDSFPITS
ncbi:probable serine/threonine-protein kinase PBL5 [Aristolochia californica]|uniref:probable serine/threonine-protein kinase PBL5 n=1 Tax=Aristolochia californica TaxID=171875 RepID=UPI0035DFE314